MSQFLNTVDKSSSQTKGNSPNFMFWFLLQLASPNICEINSFYFILTVSYATLLITLSLPEEMEWKEMDSFYLSPPNSH